MGIVEIAEDYGSGSLAGFNTGGLQPQCQSFAAEIALLDHTAHSGRKIGIVFFYKRPRILPVEAPRPIGTGRHTETAADTAVKIHGHDTVLLNHKGCLGGTGLDAGRIVAMVAERRKLAVLDFLRTQFLAVLWKQIAEPGLPDPFDFALWVGNLGYVVHFYTGGDCFVEQSLVLVELAHVDNHAEPDA